jgi:hypothetical protein
MSEEMLVRMLAGVIESNTKAMEKNAEASEKMATEVRGLRRIIAGAQEKIGREVGPIIDRQKKAMKDLEEEVVQARESGGVGAARG